MHAGCSPCSAASGGVFGTTEALGYKRQTGDDADEEYDAGESLSQIVIIDEFVKSRIHQVLGVKFYVLG